MRQLALLLATVFAENVACWVMHPWCASDRGAQLQNGAFTHRPRHKDFISFHPQALCPALVCGHAREGHRDVNPKMKAHIPSVMKPLSPSPEQRLPLGRITSLERSKIDEVSDSVYYR